MCGHDQGVEFNERAREKVGGRVGSDEEGRYGGRADRPMLYHVLGLSCRACSLQSYRRKECTATEGELENDGTSGGRSGRRGNRGWCLF